SGRLRAPVALAVSLHDALPISVLEHALLTVMFDAQSPESVHATLAAVQRVASTVRDRMSLDAWRILSRLLQDFTPPVSASLPPRSEEHTSELQSLRHLVCRLLL